MREPKILTLLFTDLVGSTELFRRLGDDDAEALRRTHFKLLRGAVASHGGQEVKNLGDGLMVVFASARDAVSAAVDIQRAMARHNDEAGNIAFEVRVGLHAGEPIRDEGDYFGTPVVVAKRLCDAAAGGQILTSELVRGLVGSRAEVAFRSLGGVALKGMSELVPACAVEWQPEAMAAATEATRQCGVGLPAALLQASQPLFVGRVAELGQLRDAWGRAQKGECQVMLVAGEAGIGKSRLCSELALEVLEQDGNVLYGRCDEDGVVPYQPFVEALRQLIPSAWGDDLSADQRAELGRLLPEFAVGVPRVGPAPATDHETDRYRLFEAVAAVLRVAAGHAPTLVVVDDLHWATKPTLLLLRHVVRACGRAAILVAGTYRHLTETGRLRVREGRLEESRLGRWLAELHRLRRSLCRRSSRCRWSLLGGSRVFPPWPGGDAGLRAPGVAGGAPPRVGGVGHGWRRDVCRSAPATTPPPPMAWRRAAPLWRLRSAVVREP